MAYGFGQEKRIKRLFWHGVITIPLVVSALLPAIVAEAESLGTLNVSPAYYDLTLNPDQGEIQDEIDIRNESNETLFVRIKAVDPETFPGAEQLFNVDDRDSASRFFDVSRIRLESSGEWIPAGVSKKIRFSLSSDDSFRAGGNYGVFLVEWDGNEAKKDTVGIGQIIAIPLFLTRTEGVLRRGDLEHWQYIRSGVGIPSSVTADFRNSGNTHLTVRGLVTVSDSFGQEVARGILNEDSALLLPDSTREYVVRLQSTRANIFPGMYTLTLKYRFDGSETSSVSKKRVFVFPSVSGVFSICTLVVGVFLLGGLSRMMKSPKGKK